MSTSVDDLDKIELAQRNANCLYGNPSFIQPQPTSTTAIPELVSPISNVVSPEYSYVSESTSTPINTVNDRTISLTAQANEPVLSTELTVKNFMSIIAQSILDILNDLLTLKWTKESITEILTKEHRMIAIGTLLVVISVFFAFFNKK